MSASNVPYNHFIIQFIRTKSILIQNFLDCFCVAMIDLYCYSVTDLPRRRIAQRPMSSHRRRWRARIRALVYQGCRDLDRLIRDFCDRPGEEPDRDAMAAFTNAEVTDFEIACAATINAVDEFFETCLDVLEEPIIGNPRILMVLERPLGYEHFRPVPMPNWVHMARILLEGRCMVATMMVLATISVARDRFMTGTLIDQVLEEVAITVEQMSNYIERIHEDEEVVVITINSH